MITNTTQYNYSEMVENQLKGEEAFYNAQAVSQYAMLRYSRQLSKLASARCGKLLNLWG